MLKKKKIYEKKFLCVNEFSETCVGWTEEHPQSTILNSTSGFPCFIDPGKTRIIEDEMRFISHYLFQQLSRGS